MLSLWKKSCDQPRQHTKKQRHYFTVKSPSSQSYGFSSSRELNHKESWVPKNWCFWAAVLEKTLESPLDCKEIKRVHPKGNQLWIFIGRTDAEAETPILWPPDVKNSLEKTLMLGKIEAGGEGDDRGRDGWMASPTWWMWVWVNSRSWWWTGKPGMLQSLGSQRVGLDWAIELNWDILDLWQYWVTPAEWDIPSGGQSILLNLVSLLHFPTGFKSKVRTLTLEVMR